MAQVVHEYVVGEALPADTCGRVIDVAIIGRDHRCILNASKIGGESIVPGASYAQVGARGNL